MIQIGNKNNNNLIFNWKNIMVATAAANIENSLKALQSVIDNLLPQRSQRGVVMATTAAE